MERAMPSRQRSLCLCVVVAVIGLGRVAVATTPLYFGGFFALSGESFPWASGLYPSVLLAMEYINNDTSLLQDYDLQMKVVDTASNSGSAMRDLIYILADDDPVVGLIGAPNSHVSMALAETTKWWNLIQIACSNYNPDLSNTEAFPLYFRTITPITAFNPALLALIQYYRWTRVAILYHHKDYETLVGSHELQAMLTDVNITVVVNEAFIDDPSEQIQKMKELDIRIIIGYFYSPEARRAFCEMHRLGMKSPKYVLLSIQTNDEWWQIDDGLTCSPEDLLNASEGAIFFVFYFERGNNTINVDVDDFGERYAELTTALGFPESLFAYHQFDAVYALALALNKSIDSLAVIGKNLSSFSYDVQTADIFYASLRDTRFMGISGVIQFDENGDRIGQVLFRQVQSDGQVEIFGVYTLSEDLFELDNGWTSVSDAPRDRINHVTVIIKTSPVVIDLAIILASCGIIFSILVMIFNIYNRKKRVIKMSSPNINNLICVGGGMAYASVILHGLGNNADSVKTHDALCKISPWVFSLGFTIGFGALFAKTWRVHRIFTSKTTKRINILDWNLFLFVGILVFIDVIILTVWTTVDPVTTNTVSMVTRVDEEQDALIFPVLRKCYSENEVIWLGLSCGYKGIILLFGVFLAWETRKVKYEALNDSHYIGASVYCVLLLSIIGIMQMIFLKDSPSLEYALSAACIITCTTSILCVVFLPKMKQLRGGSSDVFPTNVNTEQLHTNGTFQTTNHPPFKHSIGTCEDIEEEFKRLKNQLESH